MTHNLDFTLAPMTERDRTYLARLNFLTDVFGDEQAPLSSYFQEEAYFYVEKWTPESGGFVAWDGKIPAGGAWLNWDTETLREVGFAAAGIPEVAIAVESRYQGKGLASRLLAASTELARTKGAPGICLAVNTDNASAHAIYQHLGFVYEAEIPDYNYHVLVKRF